MTPLVFAHRGGAQLAPENTIAAFDNGLKCGANGLELDVHLSRDGVVMVHHDSDLDRTTNLQGPIASRTASELARSDAGFHFTVDGQHPFRGCGIGIPTLGDVLSRYEHVPIIIELKGDNPALAAATVEEVKRRGAVERVCLGSFARAVLDPARRLAPDIATSAASEEVRWALYRTWLRWSLPKVRYRAFQVPEKSGRIRVVSPAFVRTAHRARMPVQVWTVDAPGQAERLLDWGVDGLITDRPDVIVPTVKGRLAKKG